MALAFSSSSSSFNQVTKLNGSLDINFDVFFIKAYWSQITVFKFNQFPDKTYQFKLIVRRTNGHQGNIHIYLCNKNEFDVRIGMEFSGQPGSVAPRVLSARTIPAGQDSGVKNFVTEEALRNFQGPCVKSGVKSRCIKATCKFTIYERGSPSSPDQPSIIKDFSHFIQIEDPKKVLGDQHPNYRNFLPNFTIVCQEVSFKCSKHTLADWSPVFKAMIDSKDSKEAKESKIDITDSSACAVELMLRYIYGGTLDWTLVDVDSAVDLMLLADKYDIQKLVKHCSKLLRQKVNDKNAVQLLQVANRLNIQNLIEKSARRIALNYETIKHSVEWKALIKNDTQVLPIVMDEMSKMM